LDEADWSLDDFMIALREWLNARGTINRVIGNLQFNLQSPDHSILNCVNCGGGRPTGGQLLPSKRL
jgi:hypothetical protein